MPPGAPGAVEATFREESGRALASLVRLIGDIDTAEEALQEAFLTALERWPESGVPPNPGGWILVTARNKAIDKLRRESSRRQRSLEAMRMYEPEELPDAGAVRDDQLRLVFTCCHPSLAPEAQVALTLRLIAGLQTPEIARAFLVSEPTLAQRLVRAKRKITAAKIPYRVPEAHELPDRLGPVLAVVYLIFNEGYSASAGSDLVRPALCEQAIRLARLLSELMPDEPEVTGLLGLLLLLHARRDARTSPDGALVLLADQDRTRWDAHMIAEGHDLVRRCLRRNRPGPYQIQAAISAVHGDAPTADATDWRQIVALYDQLLAISPTPVVALNRAVAVGEVDGPAAALDLVETLDLSGYHPYHAARADLLRRLGRAADAASAYRDAIACGVSEPERAFYQGRLAELG